MPYKDKDRQRAYQRTWVRHKRNGSTQSVEPDVEPFEDDYMVTGVEPQSYNPMMVNYVPPTE